MEDVSLKGKVALITGGSRGMGREMAMAFARAGAAGIAITAATAPDETRDEIDGELAEVVAWIEENGSRGLAVHADVTVWDDCEMAVAKTVEAFGALHILMNHAGKSQRYHGPRDIPFWETDQQGWLDVINTNVVGTYRMAKAAVPHMLKAGWGRIVNTSKGFDSMHEAFAGAYGPSKAAVEAQALSWAEELAGTGVTCNILDPGAAINTKFGRGLVNRGLPPDVVVPVALWLASQQSDGINGCRYDVRFWDHALPNAEAAERCRTEAMFPKPDAKKKSKLDLAWESPAHPQTGQ